MVWSPLATEAACPRLRPTVDAVPIEYGSQRLVCLYDRQDPSAGQVVLSEHGVLLASLLDGRRTPSAIRMLFALRGATAVGTLEIAEFVRQLDEAYLLDSERYRERERQRAAWFRAQPTRPTAHAGGAYPAGPTELRAFLDARYMLPGGPGAAPGPRRQQCLRGLIAPHIDLHRGGHSYAWGYRELAECEPAELYVLLGTCHLPMERPFAATARPYDTPFGPVRADPDFLERLASRTPFDLFAGELSHRAEHSLEFQALYLRYIEHSGDEHSAAVVPILCVPPTAGRDGATPGEDPETADFIDALRQTIAEDGRRVCFIAGADFAHVGPQFGDPALVDRRFAEHVRRGDLEMLERVAAGDADGFYRQVTGERPGSGMVGDSRAVGGPRRICGLAPMYALLSLVGPSEGRVLHYDQWIDPRRTGSVTFGCVAFP
ncbi:MAG: AmmeMemoRadiSam system protein B [Chloroflexota bacterium]|nr:AmmeMemoRadiSam system protein B [Chloroflexota bacterium]